MAILNLYTTETLINRINLRNGILGSNLLDLGISYANILHKVIMFYRYIYSKDRGRPPSWISQNAQGSAMGSLPRIHFGYLRYQNPLRKKL